MDGRKLLIWAPTAFVLATAGAKLAFEALVFLIMKGTCELRKAAQKANLVSSVQAADSAAGGNAGASSDGTNHWFIPWDVEVARINFGANCGPTSFAALVGLEVCSALIHFPGFIERPWCNFTQMKRALRSCDVPFAAISNKFPECGLALIQWLGPWIASDFGGRKSLKFTHWVAVESGRVFDHTTVEWMSVSAWREEVASAFVQDIEGATGWAVRVGIEVMKSNKRLPSGECSFASSSCLREESLFEYSAML